jgi:hypothetical protein
MALTPRRFGFGHGRFPLVSNMNLVCRVGGVIQSHWRLSEPDEQFPTLAGSVRLDVLRGLQEARRISVVSSLQCLASLGFSCG